MNLLNKIKKTFLQLSKSRGIFIARYRPDYKYVSRRRISPDKLRPKMPDIMPPINTFQTFEDKQFFALAEKVIEDGRTFLAHDRLFILWQAVWNTHRLGLPAAEVGAYRGGSAYFLASAFRQMNGEETSIHVFDTFEGHPDLYDHQKDALQLPGSFVFTDYDEVKAYLQEFIQVELHKGEFSETVKILPKQQFSLVHLDVDIYRSTLNCLQYFAPRMAYGGTIIVDDFSSPTCPGVDEAVNEFLQARDDFWACHPLTKQLVLVKK